VTVLIRDRSFVLTSAGALLGFHASVLSDFEVETIAEVSRRWLLAPDVAISTDAEFAVVEQAVAAMRAHARRPIAAADLAGRAA
jgi:hypothetical protein